MSTDRHTHQAAELLWSKSSYSGTNGGDCVEVAAGVGVVYVRDSKAAGGGPVLRVRRSEWAAFVALAAE
ncbi:hypothetical protein GCM10010503_20790 [Streptomyces lucensis JCM 4490]|uniref:DUF397 domain-containing protein n=1 Tax=Streptomyces lucensis JCM 4490 TaxID=1306176 RepID=A0A918J2W1_9ACTN|nr:DUF397 domain-containing protein [Streptomyces lucensis]GGW43952.1 hypothetical protein GCM10010503_20790 [Streptomyces lucensis JCM 4490]